MTGHPDYKRILDEMWELHCKKAASYGSDEDSLANLRNGERFGVSAWMRCLVESDSAFYRMQNYCNGRNPSYENAENALMDAAAFAMLALLFLREERNKQYAEVADAEFEFNKRTEVREKLLSALRESMNSVKESRPAGMSGTAETWVVPEKPVVSGYREPSEEIGNRMAQTLELAK